MAINIKWQANAGFKDQRKRHGSCESLCIDSFSNKWIPTPN